MVTLEEEVRNRVEQIVDPMTGLTFGEMKMIKEVKEERRGMVRISFKPTNPICPIALKFAADIRDEALKVKGIEEALVCCLDHVMKEEINRIVNKVANAAGK